MGSAASGVKPPHVARGRRTGRWLGLVVCALVGCAAVASGQTFYKWTDTNGVVHFSDTPPANVKNVERRKLSVPPAARRAPEPTPPSAAAQATAETDGQIAENAPKPEGPARVIMVSRQTPRLGPSAMHLIGEVKNIGGADARRVGVTISAVDVTQGTPCLREDADVTPSTLKPGESGSFDIEVDSPCLYGDPDVGIAPVWD